MRKLRLYVALSELVVARDNCEKRGNREWKLQHEQRLVDLIKEYMPYGGGVDNGTKIDLDKSEAQKLVFLTAFHHMNEHGMYDGWTEHKVTVTPVFGGVEIKISGRNRNQIKDYLYEVFDTALSREVEV